MKPLLLGLTGPSSFSTDLMDMVEKYFNANFVLLYHSLEENVNYWLEQVDGVILAGGVDVHPSVYGESILNNHGLSKFDLRRDNREMSIISYCRHQKRPMLGICRGHQLIGIYYGMTMIQDIGNSVVSHNPTRSQVTLSRNEPMHSVKFTNTEVLQNDYGLGNNIEERKILEAVRKTPGDIGWVNSFHHQALHYTAADKDGVRILGTARVDLGNGRDQIVEFMDGENWISCQWHPEFDWMENSYSRAVLSRFKRMLETA